MGPSRKFPKTRIPQNPGKVTCLTIQKAFTNTQVFQSKPLDCTELKLLVTQTNHKKNLIFLMSDVALQYTVKTSFASLHN